MSTCTVSFFGTTSSGKTTLVNALLGEHLLPSAVQEMSTGLTLVHDLAPDASSPDALRARLEEAMLRHREEGGGSGLRYEIFRRIAFSAELERRHGERVSLTLIDTPGIKYVGDTENVVDLSRSNAVVVVVLGADETDPRKRGSFLNYVLAQVAQPEQLLFVLNKVDLLLASDSSVDSLETNLERLGGEVLHALRERFGADVRRPAILPVCGHAALLAITARAAQGTEPMRREFWRFWRKDASHDVLPDKRELQALGAANATFSMAFDKSPLDELARNPAAWSWLERREVVKALLQFASWKEFEDALAKRVLATVETSGREVLRVDAAM